MSSKICEKHQKESHNSIKKQKTLSPISPSPSEPHHAAKTRYNRHMHTKNNTMQNTKNNNRNHITSANHNNNNPAKIKTLPPPRSHGSTTQACAACKYQRRKCASDCILAPYFRHDCQRQFLNAHHLFGVSNIIKIVRHLDPTAKDHAMRTIIYQSDARAADPVGGCYRIIRDLEHQINLAKAELELVLHHLALCRAAAQEQPPPPSPRPYEAAVDDVNSWGCAPGHAESISSSFPHRENQDHHQRKHFNPIEECDHDDMIRPIILEHLACEEEDDFKFDCHGNIISSKNAILMDENGGVLREEDECFSYVQDHEDLKAAATFFSLTNCDI